MLIVKSNRIFQGRKIGGIFWHDPGYKSDQKFMVPKRRFSGRRKVPKHDKCTPESPPQAPPGACPPQAFAGEVTFRAFWGYQTGSIPGQRAARAAYAAPRRIPAQSRCQRRGAWGGPLSGTDKPVSTRPASRPTVPNNGPACWLLVHTSAV